MHKINYIISFLVFSMLTNVSFATVWNNTTGDGKWGTADNWSLGAVPVTVADDTGWAGIDMSGSNACVVDGTQPPAHCQWLAIGDIGSGTLNIVAGGQVGTTIWGPGDTVLARATHGGVGIINVDGEGSKFKTEHFTIGSVSGGTGTINITNGGYMECGFWGAEINSTGTINIVRGTLQIDCNPVDTPAALLTIADGGKIVVYPSSVIVFLKDQVDLAQGFINAGKIVGTSDRCPVEVTFDEDLYRTLVTVPNCNCTTYSEGDFNNDCYVDFDDLAYFANDWLSCTDPTDPDCL